MVESYSTPAGLIPVEYFGRIMSALKIGYPEERLPPSALDFWIVADTKPEYQKYFEVLNLKKSKHRKKFSTLKNTVETEVFKGYQREISDKEKCCIAYLSNSMPNVRKDAIQALRI